MTSRRIVQVFVADPDERVPLEMALLHKGEQRLTDATDEELFFEIDVKALLAQHNERRKTCDLEPVRIRDLEMIVVDVATF